MASSWHPSDRRPARWPALLAYAALWLAIGGILAGSVIVLLRGADDGDVALPPVQAIELTQAADQAGCRLRRGGQPASAAPRVEGARAAPARPGTYTAAQPVGRLIGAMRRGAVVIHYRPGVSRAELDRLVELQHGVPRGTILVPQPAMPFRLAATAWRRLLGCDRLTQQTLDAIRLFRGRYVGQGPEASG